MGRTCGEPNEIELTPIGVKLNGSRLVHDVDFKVPFAIRGDVSSERCFGNLPFKENPVNGEMGAFALNPASKIAFPEDPRSCARLPTGCGDATFATAADGGNLKRVSATARQGCVPTPRIHCLLHTEDQPTAGSMLPCTKQEQGRAPCRCARVLRTQYSWYEPSGLFLSASSGVA